MTESIFQQFKDIVSSKIAKQSKLVSPIISKILANITQLPEEALVRKYVFANMVAATTLIDILLFESPKDMSPFRREINKLRERDIEQLFKVMTARFLVIFLQNESNWRLLNSRYGNANHFVREVLALSGFDDEDYRSLFIDMRDTLDEALQCDNPGQFYSRVYRHALYRALGVPFENIFDLPVYFTELSSSAYIDTFWNVLGQPDLLPRRARFKLRRAHEAHERALAALHRTQQEESAQPLAPVGKRRAEDIPEIREMAGRLVELERERFAAERLLGWIDESDIEAEYQKLARQFAELDIQETADLIDKEFLDLTRSLASSMTPAIMERVLALAAVGSKTCQEYLCTFMIDGYKLARVYLGNLDRPRLPESTLPEIRGLVFNSVHEIFSAMRPAEEFARTSPAFQALFEDLVETWLANRQLDKVPGSDALRSYLCLMMLNGICWAFAEHQVVLRK